jgi:hypothetical protein
MMTRWSVGILRHVCRWPLVMITFVWVAQGVAAVPGAPMPPAGSLPEMSSRTRPLGRTALVAETIDHDGLRRVLDGGGFVAGSEREFFGRTAVFSHVTEQVLRFGSAAGASSYLRWLRTHATESLGAPRSVTAVRIGTEDGFAYRPQGCGCASETPTYLIGWRHGRVALTVLASGRGASAQTVVGLAGRLDHAVS